MLLTLKGNKRKRIRFILFSRKLLLPWRRLLDRLIVSYLSTHTCRQESSKCVYRCVCYRVTGRSFSAVSCRWEGEGGFPSGGISSSGHAPTLPCGAEGALPVFRPRPFSWL